LGRAIGKRGRRLAGDVRGEDEAPALRPEMREQFATSGSPLTLSTGICSASSEVWISGSKLVVAPSIGCRMPDEAIAICDRSAVIGSSWLRFADCRVSQAT